MRAPFLRVFREGKIFPMGFNDDHLKSLSEILKSIKYGALGGTRTHNPLKAADFKSAVYFQFHHESR
jgi:hypothetical protein